MNMMDKKESITFKSKKGFKDEYKDIWMTLVCPRDNSKLKAKEVRSASINKNNVKETQFPIYICPKCHKRYTSIKGKADDRSMLIDNDRLINLSARKHSAFYSNASQAKVRKIEKGYFYINLLLPGKCITPTCDNRKLTSVDVVFSAKNGTKTVRNVRYCEGCKAYYMSYEFYETIDFPFEVINKESLKEIASKSKEKDEIIKQEFENSNPTVSFCMEKVITNKLMHPITNEEIRFTNEQHGCVNYIGDKRKDLVVRSAAGGGKSIVLMERARKFLAEAKALNKPNFVVIFTYNHVLAEYIREWMRLDPADEKYIKVDTLRNYLDFVYEQMTGRKLGFPAYDGVKINCLRETLDLYAQKTGIDKYKKWGTEFWFEEFAWMRNMNIFDRSDLKVYKDLAREGRGHTHPMDANDRAAAFEMFSMYQEKMRAKKVFDNAADGDERILYITHKKSEIPGNLKYDHVLIDEAQDQTLAKMIALKSLVKQDVTVCMDANQRIYGYRWKFSQWGVNPTSKRLSYPFRCTGQIDALAESLKAHNQCDINEEDRVEHIAPTATGQKPEIICCKNAEQERNLLIALINKWMTDDPIHNIGVMCYTNAAVDKIEEWFLQEKVDYQKIERDSEFSIRAPGVKLCTIHNSKGLEFMRVILPQFYQGLLPNSRAMRDEDAMINQRNVAYVGMTRAMHQLVIIYTGNKSLFIKEMDPNLYIARTYDDVVEVELKEPTPEYQKHVMPEEKKEPDINEDDGWTF